MKSLPLIILLAFSLGDTVHKIARINTYAEEATQAYENQRYLQAIMSYEYLLNSLHLQDDHMRLNLAHAYLRFGELDKARNAYESLLQHPDQTLSSTASQQLGTLFAQQKKWEQALGSFRQALVDNPANQQARYNYELIRKYLLLHPQEQPPEETPSPGPEETKTPEQPAPLSPDQGGGRSESPGTGQRPPEQQPGGSGQDAGKQEGASGQEQEEAAGQEQGTQLGSLIQPDAAPALPGWNNRGGADAVSEKDQRAQTIHQRLRQMNLSPEKAQMLLEAMHQSEIQHIQQLPRKGTSPQNDRKPDW